MKLILAISALALSAGAALAADAPLMMEPSVSSTAGYDWSGFYAGVVGGVGMITANVPGDDGVFYGSYYGNIDAADVGGTIGLEAGTQGQYGSFVVGVEGDISWGWLKTNVNSYSDYYESHASWDWLATLRGRAGIAVDNTLFYATAGLAAVSANYGSCYYEDCEPDYSDDYTKTTTQFGIVAGVGAEVAVGDNMTLKGEVLYVGLPSTTFDVPYNSYYSATFSSSTVLARAGLNFKFN